MSTSRAALRYAKALLLEADQQSNTEVMQQDMQAVYTTMQASRELRLALGNPIIKLEDKKQVLLEVFAKQSKATHNLIEVLVHNKRADLLGGISKAYLDQYNERKGVKNVEVVTAIALTPEMEAQVLAKAKEITQAKDVILTSTINPDILGGFIIRVGDVEYNASISNQLDNIKKEFTKRL
ncbi:MAG TPA: ATP synthase F1 subunit delta [Flavobacteriaceae bacterium]|nr:ATP synthase F1 subunit delta [Flavobacteriaceae bacterium]